MKKFVSWILSFALAAGLYPNASPHIAASNAAVPAGYTVLIPFVLDYDWVGGFGNLAMVRKGGYYGIISGIDGREIIPPIYNGRFSYEFELMYIKASHNGKYGFYDTSGTLIIPLEYDEANYVRGVDLIEVKKDGKWGYLNPCGNVVIEIKYNSIGPFIRELAIASEIVGGEVKWGIIRSNGEVPVPMIYDEITLSTISGLYEARKDGALGLIDANNVTVVDFEYDSIVCFPSSGLIRVGTADLKYGLLKHTGPGIGGGVHLTVPYIYPAVYDFLSIVSNEALGLIIVAGQEDAGGDMKFGLYRDAGGAAELFFQVIYCDIVLLRADGGNRLVKVKQEGSYSVYTWAGEPVIGDYDDIQLLGGTFLIAKKDGKYRIYSLSGDRALAGEYDSAGIINSEYLLLENGGLSAVYRFDGTPFIPFEDGYGGIEWPGGFIRVEKDGGVNLLTPERVPVFPKVYGRIDWPVHGMAVVWEDGKAGLFDLSGEPREVLPVIYELVSVLDPELILVKLNGLLGVLDTGGRTVISLIYDDITPAGSSMIVTRGGKQGLYNRNGNKLIDVIYDEINSDDWPLLVSSDGKYGLYDFDGTRLIDVIYDDISVEGMEIFDAWNWYEFALITVTLGGKQGLYRLDEDEMPKKIPNLYMVYNLIELSFNEEPYESSGLIRVTMNDGCEEGACEHPAVCGPPFGCVPCGHDDVCGTCRYKCDPEDCDDPCDHICDEDCYECGYDCEHDCEEYGCEYDCRHDCDVCGHDCDWSECFECGHDCEYDDCGWECWHECDRDCRRFGCGHDCEDDEDCEFECRHECDWHGCEFDCHHDCPRDGCPYQCSHDECCSYDDECSFFCFHECDGFLYGLYDISGKNLLRAVYTEIHEPLWIWDWSRFSLVPLILVEQGEKLGIFDGQAANMAVAVDNYENLEILYEHLEEAPWLSPLFIVEKDGKLRLLDLDGNEVLTAGWASGADIHNDGFAFVQGSDGKWGLVHIQALSSTVVVPSDTVGAYINLSWEELVLPPGFEIEKYSLGKRTRTVTDKGPSFEWPAFSRMLNKRTALSLTSTAGDTITFAPVARRPRGNRERLRPWYYDSITGHGDMWVLSRRSAPAVPVPGYEYAFIYSRECLKNDPYEHDWENIEGIYMDEGGIEVDVMPTMYLVRSRASYSDGAYIPAGRPFRMRARAFGKAPRLSVRKNNTLRIKHGLAYTLHWSWGWNLVTRAEHPKGYELDLSEYTGNIYVVRPANGKKPASLPQVIRVTNTTE
jgi:hypothetical protein